MKEILIKAIKYNILDLKQMYGDVHILNLKNELKINVEKRYQSKNKKVKHTKFFGLWTYYKDVEVEWYEYHIVMDNIKYEITKEEYEDILKHREKVIEERNLKILNNNLCQN